MAFLARLGRSSGRQWVRALSGEESTALRAFASGPDTSASSKKGQAAKALRSFLNNEDESDIVMDTFKWQCKAFREVIEGMKKIEVPLDFNPEKLTKYTREVEALKKKAGYPSQEEMLNGVSEYQWKVANGDIRQYFRECAVMCGIENRPQIQQYLADVNAMVDVAEQQHGPLADSQAGFDAFKKSLKVDLLKDPSLVPRHFTIVKHRLGMYECDKKGRESPASSASLGCTGLEYLESNGLTNLQANREKWITEMYANQLREGIQQAKDEAEVLKTKFEIDDVDVNEIDFSKMKPVFS